MMGCCDALVVMTDERDALRAAIEQYEAAEPVAIADGTFNCSAPLGTPLFAHPAPAVPSQEPVAHMRKFNGAWMLDFPGCHIVLENEQGPVPLYLSAAPEPKL